MSGNDNTGTTPTVSSSAWAFLVDENLPRSLAGDLRALGYSAEHVRDAGIGGAKDPAVYAYAQSHSLTIITGDKDFSDIRAFPPPHAGIVVVEVPDTMLPAQRIDLIVRQLSTLAGQSLRNALVIVEPTRLRVRR
jgi:predicted nuclease of predicted toxin-antitoxin system